MKNTNNTSTIMRLILIIVCLLLAVLFALKMHSDEHVFIISGGEKLICKNISGCASGDNAVLEMSIGYFVEGANVSWSMCQDTTIRLEDTSFVFKKTVYYKGKGPLHFYVRAVKK